MSGRWLLTLAVAGLLAAGAWWINRAGDARGAPLPPSPTAEVVDPRAQLRRESRRLAWLRGRLDETSRAEPALADARIGDLRHEVAALETALASPPPNAQAFAAVNEEYRRQRLEAQAGRQAELLAERREIDERLRAAGERAAEATDLRARRVELDEALRVTEGAARAVEGDEVAQTRAEHAEWERRVADLRAELTFWSEQKSGAGDAGRQTRARDLQRQIQEQEASVRALERRLANP